MIYLVRHGETEWNRAGRMQGHLDAPLTLRGEAQARAVGATLRDLGVDGFPLVASPLGRTRATAAIIARVLGLDPGSVTTDTRLMEMTWGAWDGLTQAEIEARDPGEWARRKADHWDYRPPVGGESYAEVALRVADWLAGFAADEPRIVVCHGGAGRVVRGLYGGLSQAETLAQEEPQDAFHLLRDGLIGRIDTVAP
ncbi:MAG: histidine phosphatase family protein [Proteobacteria bacterium]|nr:histidine phosphatase family protein [Pseudomonadota bacterium]